MASLALNAKSELKITFIACPREGARRSVTTTTAFLTIASSISASYCFCLSVISAMFPPYEQNVNSIYHIIIYLSIPLAFLGKVCYVTKRKGGMTNGNRHR